MTEVGVLLGATQSLSALSLRLVFLVGLVVFITLAGALGLMLGNALGLWLLVGGSLGSSLGLGLGGLALLFALYLGIFGGVPGFKDLYLVRPSQ